MTILIEASAKKNRGAEAPRRNAFFVVYLLRLGLVSLYFLRNRLDYRGSESGRRVWDSRGINLFLAT
jgi:hypothetical protein